MDIYLNGCNNGGNNNHEDGVDEVFILSCQGRGRAPMLLLFVF